MRSKKAFIAVAVVAFLVGIAFAGGVIAAKGDYWFGNAQGNDETVPGSDANSLPGVESGAIASIVDKAGPAVVKIETYVTTSQSSDPFFDDPFFREFFKQFDYTPQKKVQQGLGSGFIISPDGYILTNEHVVLGAQEIQVSVVGRKSSVPAKVVGTDHELDLAVLKIDAGKDLPVLKLGNSSAVAVGNWVIAIGNPYGLDHTVTVGVISAKGRPVVIQDRSFRNLLQTDASINPGNSGGPLLDLKGEVIGINTAVAQAQGIGFAIPSDTVESVLDDLIKQGKVKRGWLGVEIQDVTPAIAEYLGLSEPEGVLIRSVVQGGPAEKAGLKQGDVITAVDGKKVKTADDLLDIIREAGPGKKVQLTIWRDKKTENYAVTLTERPE
ncbi:MAG: trypsin-like peptidase domain-containing protein [Syntrophaceticus sp.]